jgi:hypothetical protein
VLGVVVSCLSGMPTAYAAGAARKQGCRVPRHATIFYSSVTSQRACQLRRQPDHLLCAEVTLHHCCALLLF